MLQLFIACYKPFYEGLNVNLNYNLIDELYFLFASRSRHVEITLWDDKQFISDVTEEICDFLLKNHVESSVNIIEFPFVL